MMYLSRTTPILGVALAAVAAFSGTAVLSSPLTKANTPGAAVSAPASGKVAQNSATRSFLPQVIVPKTTATRPEPANGKASTPEKPRARTDAAAVREPKSKNRFKGHFYQIGVFW